MLSILHQSKSESRFPVLAANRLFNLRLDAGIEHHPQRQFLTKFKDILKEPK
jgi:hypothetical protein